MRTIFAGLLFMFVGACASLTGGVVRDLTPAYADPAAFDGRTFDGDLYIVTDPANPEIYRLSQTQDGAQFFALQSGAQQRLQDWNHLNPGHRFHARGIIRPSACGAAGDCAPNEPSFSLRNLEITRIQ